MLLWSMGGPEVHTSGRLLRAGLVSLMVRDFGLHVAETQIRIAALNP
jgi:hypothetical protein